MKLDNVVLPNSLQKLGNRCFSDTHLSHIRIPGSVATIPLKCFANNVFLKTVEIENGVKVIEERAFEDTNLTVLVIPKSVYHLQTLVIESCTDNSNVRVAFLGMKTRINTGKGTRSFPDEITIFCHPGSVTDEKAKMAGYNVRNIKEFEMIETTY